MNYDYQPIYYGRRIISWIIDFLVICLIPNMLFDYYSLEFEYTILAGIFGVLIFSLIGTSPGKSFLRLKLLNEDRARVEIRKRVLRNLPLYLFAPLVILELIEANMEIKELESYLVILWSAFALIVPLLVFANYGAVFFSKGSRTLLDILLKTQILIEPKIPQAII